MATDFQTQPFAIPMANMNLPPSEALNQIMDNLNHLNVIVNQAVNTIHSRIKQESELLTSISKRIDNAYKKTVLIASNPNKSTTIFSSPNYPTNTQQISTDKPLVNKATNSTYPIAPKRTNYDLSLKQRNQKPTNTETVSLLQSINKKTQTIKSDTNNNNNTLQNTQIPQWVQSVADCVIFGTNKNAYKPCKNSDVQRRRYQKRKKISINTKNDRMASAPPSICDKYYNTKTERKTYGNRIKYRCVLDRENMPKLQFNSNLFDTQNNQTVSAVTDMKWKDNNENEHAFMIPSDVLNARDMNMQFEFGETVKPPNDTSINNQVIFDEKDEEKATEIHAQIHMYPTPKDMNQNEEKQIEIKQQNVQFYPTPKEVVDVTHQEKSEMKQPFVSEVNAQNESLQNMGNINVDIEEKKEIIIAKDFKEENKAQTEQCTVKQHSNNVGIVRFEFDKNALIKAKERLKRKKVASKSENKEEIKKDSVQGTIFSAMKNLRRFHTDSDDEQDSDGSFYDSDSIDN